MGSSACPAAANDHLDNAGVSRVRRETEARLDEDSCNGGGQARLAIHAVPPLACETHAERHGECKSCCPVTDHCPL